VAIERNLLAVDVECHRQGAPACTGARGNCESRADKAVVIDAARGTVTNLATGFWAGADTVRFSPDGTKLAVMHQSGREAELFDPTTGALIKRVAFVPQGAGLGIGCAAWATDGATLFGSIGSTIAAASTTGAKAKTVEHPKISSPIFCEMKAIDKDVLLFKTMNTLVRFRLPLLDAPADYDGEIVGAATTDGTMSPDGRIVIFSAGTEASIFDVATWTATKIIKAEGPISFSPTSTHVAIGRGVWELKAPFRRVATLN